MKFSLSLRNLLAVAPRQPVAACCNWMHDPYNHPVIAAMSERERADLPPVHLPPGRAGCTLARCPAA
jgi:hypothetical protein